MATCELTGKKPNTANHVSHAHNKTKRRQFPNIQRKRIWLPDEKRWVRLMLSTRAIRSLNRMGLKAFARKQGISLKSLLERHA